MDVIIVYGVIVFLIVVFRKQLRRAWDWLSEQNTFGKMVDEGKMK